MSHLVDDFTHIMIRIKALVERAYVDHSSLQGKWSLEYQDFEVLFKTINFKYDYIALQNDTDMISNMLQDLVSSRQMLIESHIELTCHCRSEE